jgi:hypothetical protein
MTERSLHTPGVTNSLLNSFNLSEAVRLRRSYAASFIVRLRRYRGADQNCANRQGSGRRVWAQRRSPSEVSSRGTARWSHDRASLSEQWPWSPLQ